MGLEATLSHMLLSGDPAELSMAMREAADPAQDALMARYLRDMRLSNLGQRDYETMHRIIKKIVKVLNDTLPPGFPSGLPGRYPSTDKPFPCHGVLSTGV